MKALINWEPQLIPSLKGKTNLFLVQRQREGPWLGWPYPLLMGDETLGKDPLFTRSTTVEDKDVGINPKITEIRLGGWASKRQILQSRINRGTVGLISTRCGAHFNLCLGHPFFYVHPCSRAMLNTFKRDPNKMLKGNLSCALHLPK